MSFLDDFWDWLIGDDDETQITHTQSPQQKQVFNALSPLLDRLGSAATGSYTPNSYLTNWNQGVNPWTGATMGGRAVNRQPRPYPTRMNLSPTEQVAIKAVLNGRMPQKTTGNVRPVVRQNRRV
jgi:hypothetical protein